MGLGPPSVWKGASQGEKASWDEDRAKPALWGLLGWRVSVWGSGTHTQFLFLVCSSEESDLNPKVLQLIRGENIKVRDEQNSGITFTAVLELLAHTGLIKSSRATISLLLNWRQISKYT